MTKFILTIMFAICLVSLVALPFEEGFDAAIDEMVTHLKSPKTDCVVIASALSSDDGQVYYPEMDTYLAKHLAERLENVNKIKVIPNDAVSVILKSKYKKFKLPSDYKTYQAVLKDLFESTNKTGSVFLSVTMLPDTETGLSTDGFTCTFTLYNPNTATQIGQSGTKIPRDEMSDGLLGITRQSQVSFTKTETIVIPGTTKPVETPAPVGDWFEDFSSYAVGDQLTAWGKDAFVFQGADRRHYLSSESGEKYYTNFQIRFPQDFILKFDFVGTNFDGDLMLCDNNDKEFKITFGRIWDRNCFIQLADNKSSEVTGRDINTLRFEKKGNALKVFLNGEFAQSADSSDLGALRSFKFKIPGKVQFTNFSLTPNL